MPADDVLSFTLTPWTDLYGLGGATLFEAVEKRLMMPMRPLAASWLALTDLGIKIDFDSIDACADVIPFNCSSHCMSLLYFQDRRAIRPIPPKKAVQWRAYDGLLAGIFKKCVDKWSWLKGGQDSVKFLAELIQELRDYEDTMGNRQGPNAPVAAAEAYAFCLNLIACQVRVGCLRHVGTRLTN